MPTDIEHNNSGVPIQRNASTTPLPMDNNVPQIMDAAATDNHNAPLASTKPVAILTKTTQPASVIPSTYTTSASSGSNATRAPETANPIPSITAPTVTASSYTASVATITTVMQNNKAKKKASKKKGKKSEAQRVVEAQEVAENEEEEEEDESRGRGRVPWATGIIEQFLLGFMSQYQSEIVGDQKRAPAFYNEVVRLLFTVHGWGVFFHMLVERGIKLEPARRE